MKVQERNKDGMWTVEDLRAHLNIGRTKAWELIRRQDIPAVRVGRLVRLRERDVEEFVERNPY